MLIDKDDIKKRLIDYILEIIQIILDLFDKGYVILSHAFARPNVQID